MQRIQLPINCDLTYYPDFLSDKDNEHLFNYITKNIEFTNRIINPETGDEFVMDILKCMFLDTSDPKLMTLHETYGKKYHWPKPLSRIKSYIEEICMTNFDVCVCIYYPDGNSGVDFHSDLTAFGDTSLIPSLSLGTERTFILRNKNNFSDSISLRLKNGSLLIMGEGCQERYEHSLPVDSSISSERINLTFRKFDF